MAVPRAQPTHGRTQSGPDCQVLYIPTGMRHAKRRTPEHASLTTKWEKLALDSGLMDSRM